MSHVHYKFSSLLSSDVVTFPGPSIALGELKHRIMACKKLRAANSDLQILNAQTNEEYTDANALILKNSSVIVRRVPAGAGTAASRAEAKCQKNPAKGTPKAIADPSVPLPLAQLIESPSLAETNVPEEEKIKVMMLQSCSYYDPSNYLKAPLGPVPPPNTCFKCGQQGHCKKKCPNTGNKTTEGVPKIKRSSGIPASFMVEVKDPKAKGIMITPKGKYAIPIINVEAYARDKKEKPPLLQEEPAFSSSSSSPAPIPDKLLCVIPREIRTDAAVIPCCGRSYCDDCTRTASLEPEGHTSPTGHQTSVSADSSNANQLPGQAVNDLQSGKPTWELKLHSRPRSPGMRDEPVKADSVIFKPKARTGKRKRKAKVTAKRQFNQTSSSFPRQRGHRHGKRPRMEPPVKEVKKE
ncbi:E3 ubiquitin-protein ligase RBBP6-like isoform X2 [Neopelma chrysocephalum]|uniref:E3 ubiquitin-protein ligase RBBP6-like isoform X2 n=1 Tax=Neopelma chrysocephalum TaxID=114329 RepID=UPI000FCD24BE|nr:E3 ubiquitin-protein ligase RBBP6-like isoform X2 [Neopelma chrysocephalum]